MGSSHSSVENAQSENGRKFTHFSQEEIQSWSESFHKAFPSKEMRVQDLEKLLRNFFPFGDPQAFSRTLFRTINISGTDTVDFHEMLIAFSILTKGSNFEKLRWIFRFYDSDNDGVVSKGEMVSSAKALADMVGTSFDEEIDVEAAIDEVFREAENESGFLTFDDFRTLAMRKSQAFAMLCVFSDE